MSQPYFAEGTEAMITLEAMVDKVGMRNIVYALSHIADAKAEHIATNWQDKLTASHWERVANQLDAFAHKLNTPFALGRAK